MDYKEMILTDCRKILKSHMDREATDWDLWWDQVHAMDNKYKKRGEEVYRYMQACIKSIFKALQTLEGVIDGKVEIGKF